MRQLPCARDTKDSELDQCPANHARVGGLGLISEFGLAFLYRGQLLHSGRKSYFCSEIKTYPLENLLPPDILQSSIQILDLADNVADLALVAALDGAGLTNGHVELEPDVSGWLAAHQPALGRGHVGRGEADAVVAAVGSAEGEATFGGAALGYYAVVVVEGFVDADVDAHVRGWLVLLAVLVVLFCFIVA